MPDQLPDWLKGDGLQTIGRELKAARVARRLTLDELSRAVALNKGYLSKLERGLRAPSVGTVLNLARALNVSVAQLFGEEVDDAAIHVSRVDGRPRSGVFGDSGYRLEALTTGKEQAGIEGFLVYPPAEFTDEFRAEHNGEELLFVVAGDVEVKFADRMIALGQSEALQFPGRLQHQVRRTSTSACVLIAVTRS